MGGSSIVRVGDGHPCNVSRPVRGALAMWERPTLNVIRVIHEVSQCDPVLVAPKRELGLQHVVNAPAVIGARALDDTERCRRPRKGF